MEIEFAPWLLRRDKHGTVDISGEITIGRDPSCTIMLDGRGVSRVHCRVRMERRRASPVLDNESRYGTLVNGAPVEQSVELKEGDVIEVPGHELVVARRRLTMPWLDPSRPPPRILHAHPADYEVELVEGPGGVEARYQDAVAIADHGCLLVMLDLIGTPGADVRAALVAGWRSGLRLAATRMRPPDQVLEQIHADLVQAGLKARATCARLDVAKQVVLVATSGPFAPWIVRASGRVAAVRLPPTVDMGTSRSMRFEVRVAHFDRGDALIIPSDKWAPELPPALAKTPPEPGKAVDWVHALPVVDEGAVFCLTRAPS